MYWLKAQFWNVPPKIRSTKLPSSSGSGNPRGQKTCVSTESALTASNTWCVQVLRSPKEAFAAAKQSWRERCEKCVCLQGDYVEKWLHFQLPVVSSFFLNKLGDLRSWTPHVDHGWRSASLWHSFTDSLESFKTATRSFETSKKKILSVTSRKIGILDYTSVKTLVMFIVVRTWYY